MSILLLPFLLLLIFIVIRYILPMIRLKMYAFITWRKSLILACIYLGILILLVPILYVLPNKGFMKSIGTPSQFNIISQIEIADWLANLPEEGDFPKQPGIYNNSSNTYKVDSKKLAIEGFSKGHYQIFVGRKTVDDGEINVSSYIATHSADYIDFTKLVLPPTSTYKNGTLFLKPANYQTFDFKQFSSDFTVKQFKTRAMEAENGMTLVFGWKVVYIRVPKSMEIDLSQTNVQIQMINSN